MQPHELATAATGLSVCARMLQLQGGWWWQAGQKIFNPFPVR